MFFQKKLPNIVRIMVTAGDIEKGLKHNARECPVALAAKREFGLTCSTGLGSIFVFNKSEQGILAEYDAPGTSAFIRKFDDGEEVSPQSFYLRKYA